MPIKLNNRAVKYFIPSELRSFSVGWKGARAIRVMDGLNNEHRKSSVRVNVKPLFIVCQNVYFCLLYASSLWCGEDCWRFDLFWECTRARLTLRIELNHGLTECLTTQLCLRWNNARLIWALGWALTGVQPPADGLLGWRWMSLKWGLSTNHPRCLSHHSPTIHFGAVYVCLI